MPLNRIIEIQQPVITRDPSYGSEMTTWTTLDQVWAEKRQTSGKERFSHGWLPALPRFDLPVGRRTRMRAPLSINERRARRALQVMAVYRCTFCGTQNRQLSHPYQVRRQTDLPCSDCGRITGQNLANVKRVLRDQ